MKVCRLFGRLFICSDSPYVRELVWFEQFEAVPGNEIVFWLTDNCAGTFPPCLSSGLLRLKSAYSGTPASDFHRFPLFHYTQIVQLERRTYLPSSGPV